MAQMHKFSIETLFCPSGNAPASPLVLKLRKYRYCRYLYTTNHSTSTFYQHHFHHLFAVVVTFAVVPTTVCCMNQLPYQYFMIYFCVYMYCGNGNVEIFNFLSLPRHCVTQRHNVRVGIL